MSSRRRVDGGSCIVGKLRLDLRQDGLSWLGRGGKLGEEKGGMRWEGC